MGDHDDLTARQRRVWERVAPRVLEVARARAAQLGREVELVEGDAERLSFADASFDTVVCALARWPPLRWAQRLVEQVTVRSAGEHFTRRSRPLVEHEGGDVDGDRGGARQTLAAGGP